MKKLFSFFYTLCWICLTWGVFAAVPFQLFSADAAVSPQSAESPFPDWLRVLLPMLILLLLLLVVSEVLRLRAVQAYRMIRRIGGGLLVLTLCGIGKWVADTFVATADLLGVVLGVVMVLLLQVLALVISSRDQSHNKSAILWKVVLLAATAIGLTLWVPGMWGLSLPTVSLSGDLLDYHIGQLSLTFVTISVMSVLSDKSVIIYWENIAEAKLLKPVFGSFASCTAYSISCAVGAGISVLLGNALAFLVFLVLNVVSLILLTLTMVDVYFNREQKKQRLETQLLKSSSDDRTKMMYQLQQHLYQAIESHDLLFVREVAELYGGYLPCFDSPEGRKVKALLDSSDMDIPSHMVKGIRHRAAQMKRKREWINALETNAWREDGALWNLLAKGEGPYDVLLTLPPMYLAVWERMNLLVMDVLTNSSRLYQAGYLSHREVASLLHPPYRINLYIRAVRRNFNTFATVCGLNRRKTENYPKTLLEKLQGNGSDLPKDEQAAAFLTSLLRVALRVAKTDGEQKLWLQNHPLLVGLDNHLDNLALTEEEIAALRKFID